LNTRLSRWQKSIEPIISNIQPFANWQSSACPHPKWGEIVKAAVVLKPGKTLSADELIAFCRQSLANYKIPRRIEFSETELPKSGCGRILKQVARARLGSSGTSRRLKRFSEMCGLGTLRKRQEINT
jgi:acyl-CoA synthetase (AMP-forming)/AMP-acid ligase II